MNLKIEIIFYSPYIVIQSTAKNYNILQHERLRGLDKTLKTNSQRIYINLKNNKTLLLFNQ